MQCELDRRLILPQSRYEMNGKVEILLLAGNRRQSKTFITLRT